MTKLIPLTALLFLFISCQASAQTLDILKQQIQQIISTKNAEVSFSISGNDRGDTLSISGDRRVPMQSVFKFHIALAMLSEIDQGRFSLSQKVKIAQKDLLPGLYSPLREKYPKGGNFTIAEILEYTVSQSDNVGCDALLRLLGGPRIVEDYFVKKSFKDISIKINEEVMQSNWDLQFQNWTTPNTANEVLAAFYYNDKNLLSKKSYDFIWRVMRETETGKGRLKGQLPKGTIVAHKTGSSGTNPTLSANSKFNSCNRKRALTQVAYEFCTLWRLGWLPGATALHEMTSSVGHCRPANSASVPLASTVRQPWCSGHRSAPEGGRLYSRPPFRCSCRFLSITGWSPRFSSTIEPCTLSRVMFEYAEARPRPWPFLSICSCSTVNG